MPKPSCMFIYACVRERDKQTGDIDGFLSAIQLREIPPIIRFTQSFQGEIGEHHFFTATAGNFSWFQQPRAARLEMVGWEEILAINLIKPLC